MRRHLRLISVLVFSLLFGFLISGLLAHAEDGLTVETTDPSYRYPVEALKAAGLRVEEPRPAPWFVRKARERHRIFETAKMDRQIRDWDELDKDVFLDRLDRKGAAAVLSQYPEFKMSQLQSAEAELKKVKNE